MDRSSRLDLLSDADRRIADAEMAVMKQIADFDRQRGDQLGNASAERTLRAFVDALEALRGRRELIAQTIKQIDDGLI
jgi:hypothetical protein